MPSRKFDVQPARRSSRRPLVAFIAAALVAIAASGAQPSDRVGHRFWVFSTSKTAMPIPFEALDDRTGLVVYSGNLKDGQTIEIWSIDTNHGMQRFRAITDEGKAIFIGVDVFERALYSADEYRRDAPLIFGLNQHLFDGPPEPILAEADAAAAKAKAAARKAYRARPDAQIGMTMAEVRKSKWGPPDHINRTTTAAGVREQWVYGAGNYLYFENGVLVAAQN